MSDDPIQRATLIAVLIGISSTNISNFLVGILNSNGLMNRLDVLLLIIMIWIVFFMGFSMGINILAIFEAKSPGFVAFMRRLSYITLFVAGVFVSLYINNYVNQVNFLTFGITEVILIVVGAIIFLATLQLLLEQLFISGDPRFELVKPRKE